ncbi:hypothetical protein HMPREF1863_00486 [Aedoeadaptatus coxii]|uniref:Uncharacterized protein n=1 Tax=Aedoeadaptatus coxii TaxID=755172 RepID=A0A134AHW8_9FIRM|nr:hypothetical protein HMPREF1863_00486 [Peptoniphilus coxii]
MKERFFQALVMVGLRKRKKYINKKVLGQRVGSLVKARLPFVFLIGIG